MPAFSASESPLAALRRLIEQERLWDDHFLESTSETAKTKSRVAVVQAPAANPVTETQKAPVPVISTVAPAVPLAAPLSSKDALQAVYDAYHDCVRCPLGATRIKFVFGVGSPEARVMFIGEGPGYEEDRRGEPFVGKAGQLLDKIMGAINLSRDSVYIANIVKCHPMENPETPDARGNDRAPNALEVETCSPILLRQIAAIRPAFLVTLGAPSTRMILRTTEGITKLRGRLMPFPVDGFYPQDIPAGGLDIDAATRLALSKTTVLPTYHPAALLRNPDLKKDVWTDMKLLREQLQTLF